jgi:hypothetical protein
MSDLENAAHGNSRPEPPSPESEPPQRSNVGQFQRGNTAGLKHGAYRSLDRPEALIAIKGKQDEVIQQLGGDLSQIQTDLVTDYARVDVLIESVVSNIEVGGIFTPKGRARAAVTMLMSLMDRRLRLALTLGLERRQRPVHPIDAVRAAIEKANSK